MAITISGENNNDRILAQDGVIDSISGFNIAGIITASSFTGDLTGDVTGDLTGNVTGNINNTTLLLQTGGSERVRIDSSGRVGLGIDNPGSYFSSYNRVVMGRTGDTGGMTIVSAPTSGGYIAFADGTSGNQAYRGRISYYHNVDSLAFNTSATERVRINSSGNVGVGTNNVSTRLEIEGPTALTNHNQTLLVRDSVADDATGRGGNIGFGAYVDGTMRTLAAIGAFKKNGGTGFDGHLALYTRRNGVGPVDEVMRLESGGNVGIGTSSPETILTIAKNATNQTVATIPTVRLTNLDTTAVATDIVGSYEFFSKDVHSLNKVTGFMRNIPTDAGVNYDLTFGTIKTGDSNAVERLRIDSSGRVGIGTNNPAEDLHIGSNSPYILLDDYDNARKWKLKGTAWFAIEDTTAGADRLRIDSSGRIGIGEDSPGSYSSGAYNLVISSPSGSNTGISINSASGGTDSGAIFFSHGTASGANGVGRIRYYHSDDHMDFWTANAERFRIASDGVATFAATNINVNRNAGDAFIALQTSGTSNVALYGGASTGFRVFTKPSGGSLTERLRIADDGTITTLGTTARSDWITTTLKPSFQIASSYNPWLSLFKHSNDPYGPYLLLGKTRGTSATSNTVVQDGDELGNIQFEGTDGSTFRPGARIVANIDGTPGSGDMPTRLTFHTTSDGGSNVTERLRIDRGGNIKQGTSTPTAFTGGAPNNTQRFLGKKCMQGSVTSTTTLDSSGNGTFDLGRLWLTDDSSVELFIHVCRNDSATYTTTYAKGFIQKVRGTGMSQGHILYQRSAASGFQLSNLSSGGYTGGSSAHGTQVDCSGGAGGVIYRMVCFYTVLSKNDMY